MDIDTVSKKNSHEEILRKFREEKIDILIGTQMITKGHHFPNVTLVGVIAADGSLGINDFRASEKTFQLLTQVSGRAGREDSQGRVIIQTYNPDNFSIEFAQKQNYKKFYEIEVMLRKQLKYPPFCDILLLGFSSEKEEQIKNVSKIIYEFLKNKIKSENIPIILYKATPSPIDKIKNKYRWRIIIKCKFNQNIIKLVEEVLKIEEVKRNNLVKITVDVNPNSML